jgi:3-dehydroquinate synthase
MRKKGTSMKTISVKAKSGTSKVLIGGSLDDLPGLIGDRRAIIITDANVNNFYSERFPDTPTVVIEPGEDSKNLDTIRTIYERCVELELDRDALVVGIGGGVVCDIAGFAGATFLRGVDFGFVATSLLAQVDASVGGKNGVDLGRYKNLVGTFSQPEFVVVDHRLLETLPAIELRSGLAEVVKAAAIADAKLFAFLEENLCALLTLDGNAIDTAIRGAVEVKAQVVMQDERESGLRRLLNFGHTFGHAVERISGLSHGEAVSVGMVVAANLSKARGLLDQRNVDRLENVLSGLKLPTEIQADGEIAFDAMRRDKKRVGDAIHFVLLEAIGKAIVSPIGLDELKGVIDDMCRDH